MPGWQFWIDRGGTFTDIVAVDPEGRLRIEKVLSASDTGTDAVLAGLRRCLDVGQEADLSQVPIDTVRIGTTVATNALLERKGARTALVITHGLEDQLEIGTQARPDIFALRVVKPKLLYTRVIGALERVRADGAVELPLDCDRLGNDLADACRAGVEAVAIVFMHGYAFPEHERTAARLARSLGFAQVSASHEVVPLIRLVHRGDTTVADAYLSPVVRRYVEAVSEGLGGAEGDRGAKLLFMTSAGGLKSKDVFRGSDAVLSGPAGGVVAMAETARRAGFERVIGFDMGGTSTDVSHFAGAYERTFETEVAGVRLAVPMLRVNTIAAGGGSILTFDGTRFKVGPESAGSDPGPMSYRRGGPLTVTDANLMIGKLLPKHFPAIFGARASQPLDREAVAAAFAVLARSIDDGRAPEAVADGFIQVAVDAMARAIKTISVARGYDVTQYSLNAFGSAAGQHACLLADALGIETVLITPFSGVLSTLGMGLAPLRASRERSLERPLEGAEQDLVALSETGAAAAVGEVVEQGIDCASIAVTTLVHVRYAGSESALAVPLGTLDDMAASFAALHRQRFGFVSPEKALVAAAIEVEAVSGRLALPEISFLGLEKRGRGGEAGELEERARFFSGGVWHDAPVVERASFAPGRTLEGPALVIEPHQTVVVEPGWRLTATPRHDLVLTRARPRGPARRSTAVDPVLLEVMNGRFTAVAEDMGEALRLTAQSVNIKERLDFSCALFDAAGALIANAPHVPVHLGSMDRAVAAVIRAAGSRMRPGDSFMLNTPYDGGTHLPDITIVTPVFDEAGEAIRAYVASRGHHADIGGLAPGSMSPLAATIDEEGVYIPVTPLVEGGCFREAETLALLAGALFPARNPPQNVADLKAQVAANTRGVIELGKMDREFGPAVVTAYMQHVQAAAEESVRRLIATLPDGHFRVAADQGFVVAVRATVDRAARSLTIDFTGTSPAQPSNFNAPEPVARAAVLYVIRVLLGQPIPLNAGCLRPVTILIPEGSMLKPTYPAAVAAGNVETSQIVTNCLFGAFGALASAQGTMNNLTFGNERVQYYETICSGAPAGPGFDGAAGVHVHMTNTRLTDPEVLESRFPVLLEEFSIRRGSGGRGRWSSGDGTRRVIRFLEPMTCAILSGYRRVRPFGLDGGEPGLCGRNVVRRNTGPSEALEGCAATALDAGEAIVIETPTGGGVGTLE